MWRNWLVGLLGLWVILVPFLGFSSGANTVVLVITGIVVAVFGFWAASGERGSKPSTPPMNMPQQQ